MITQPLSGLINVECLGLIYVRHDSFVENEGLSSTGRANLERPLRHKCYCHAEPGWDDSNVFWARGIASGAPNEQCRVPGMHELAVGQDGGFATNHPRRVIRVQVRFRDEKATFCNFLGLHEVIEARFVAELCSGSLVVNRR